MTLIEMITKIFTKEDVHICRKGVFWQGSMVVDGQWYLIAEAPQLEGVVQELYDWADIA